MDYKLIQEQSLNIAKSTLLYEFDAEHIAGVIGRKAGSILHKVHQAGDAHDNFWAKLGEKTSGIDSRINSAIRKGINTVRNLPVTMSEKAGKLEDKIHNAVAQKAKTINEIPSKVTSALKKGFELGKKEGDYKPPKLPDAPSANLKKPSMAEFTKKIVNKAQTQGKDIEGFKKYSKMFAKAAKENRAEEHAKKIAAQKTEVAKTMPKIDQHLNKQIPSTMKVASQNVEVSKTPKSQAGPTLAAAKKLVASTQRAEADKLMPKIDQHLNKQIPSTMKVAANEIKTNSTPKPQPSFLAQHAKKIAAGVGAGAGAVGVGIGTKKYLNRRKNK